MADTEVDHGFAPGEDAVAVVKDVGAVDSAKHMLEHEYFQDNLEWEVGAGQAMTRSVGNLGENLAWMGALEYMLDVWALDVEEEEENVMKIAPSWSTVEINSPAPLVATWRGGYKPPI